MNFKYGQTRDYDRFTIMDSNREINPKKVEKFVGLIKDRGVQQPIIVNTKGQIVDGQHRYMACKKIGAVIPYVISKKWESTDDTIVLQEGSGWTALDHCHSQAVLGDFDCGQAMTYADMFHKQSNARMKRITALELILNGKECNVLNRLKKKNYQSNLHTANKIFNIIMLCSKYPSATSVFGQKIVRPIKKMWYINDGLNARIMEKMFKLNYIKAFAKDKDQLEYMTDLYNKYNKNRKNK
jgi:hypothetical protein